MEQFDDELYIKESINIMDDSFTWYVPDNKDEYIKALVDETSGNPHLHIYKYASSVKVLAKHKARNDVLYMLPNKECAIVHLAKIDKNETKNDNDLHFVFFSNCRSAFNYIERQYRTEFLGEKEFSLAPKDKLQIFILLVQILTFFIVPHKIRGVLMVVFGVILYALILIDWKANGFNLFRDWRLDHSKVIPLLRYQIVYIIMITLFAVIGIAMAIMSKVMFG